MSWAAWAAARLQNGLRPPRPAMIQPSLRPVTKASDLPIVWDIRLEMLNICSDICFNFEGTNLEIPQFAH